jgi:hypothetical protein
MTRFWIVWSPTGLTPPRVQHANYDEAKSAAESMARQNPGHEFYALCAVSVSRKTDVTTLPIGYADDGIPF